MAQEDIAALLIGIDLAEGDFQDLGLTGSQAYAQPAAMIEHLRPT